MTADDLASDLARMVASGTRRIEKLDHAGRTFWVKRAERLSPRMRLQKGDPLAAFEAERRAHRDFLAKGLPVPRIVAEAPDFIVTEDGGPTLRHMLFQNLVDRETWRQALADAARGLARFHEAGVSHGRPNLKDICWKDGRVTFLDFERAGRDGAGQRAAALDVLIFLFSVTADTKADAQAFETARDAYLSAGNASVWNAARTRLRRYRPLAWLLAPVAWVQPGNREFNAIGPFLRLMLG